MQKIQIQIYTDDQQLLNVVDQFSMSLCHDLHSLSHFKTLTGKAGKTLNLMQPWLS